LARTVKYKVLPASFGTKVEGSDEISLEDDKDSICRRRKVKQSFWWIQQKLASSTPPSPPTDEEDEEDQGQYQGGVWAGGALDIGA
jgi:hypothetical protein